MTMDFLQLKIVKDVILKYEARGEILWYCRDSHKKISMGEL